LKTFPEHITLKTSANYIVEEAAAIILRASQEQYQKSAAA